MHIRWWWGFTSKIQLAIVLFPAQHYNYIGVLYLVLFAVQSIQCREAKLCKHSPCRLYTVEDWEQASMDCFLLVYSKDKHKEQRS